MTKLNVDQSIRAILSAEDELNALVRAAGLDPATALRNADCRGVDFGSDDLSCFDFFGSDVSRADFSKSKGITPGQFREAVGVDSAIWPEYLSINDILYESKLTRAISSGENYGERKFPSIESLFRKKINIDDVKSNHKNFSIIGLCDLPIFGDTYHDAKFEHKMWAMGDSSKTYPLEWVVQAPWINHIVHGEFRVVSISEAENSNVIPIENMTLGECLVSIALYHRLVWIFEPSFDFWKCVAIDFS